MPDPKQHGDALLDCPLIEGMLRMYAEPTDEQLHDLAHLVVKYREQAPSAAAMATLGEMALILATACVRQRLELRRLFKQEFDFVARVIYLETEVANLETQLVNAQVAHTGNLDLGAMGVR